MLRTLGSLQRWGNMALGKKKRKVELPAPEPMTFTDRAESGDFRSESVKLAEQLDLLNKSIETHRGQIRYHEQQALGHKEQLTVALLTHGEVRAKLTSATEVAHTIV